MKNIFFLISLFLTSSAFAQSYIEYPKGYKAPRRSPVKRNLKKELPKTKVNKDFDLTQINFSTGESYLDINNTKNKGNTYSFSLTRVYKYAFTELSFERSSYEFGSAKTLSVVGGFSYFLSSNIRPYLGLGISRLDFSAEENTSFIDSNGIGPSLVFGSNLYRWSKFNLGIQYRYTKYSNEEYDKDIKQNLFLMNLGFSW